MTIGERIRQLRREKGWTQVVLAEKLDVHQKQISSYEREVNTPSTEVLVKLGEAFGVTLDYLVAAVRGQAARLNIQDRELLRRFEAVDQLSQKDKELAKDVLDLLILKHRFHELVGSGPA